MVAIPMRHEEELTGRARARPGWFGRLVLQVEVRIYSYSACPPRPGADRNAWRELMRSQGTQRTHWRDATWEDLQARRRDFQLVRPGLIEPPEPWPRSGGNVNPPPTYARPPAPPGPPPTDAQSRHAWERAVADGLAAGLADPNSPISRVMTRHFGAARRR